MFALTQLVLPQICSSARHNRRNLRQNLLRLELFYTDSTGRVLSDIRVKALGISIASGANLSQETSPGVIHKLGCPAALGALGRQQRPPAETGQSVSIEHVHSRFTCAQACLLFAVL